ncbi:site-specific DNA-methyltransferase, partial [Candidatus Falkowbacteria bacterium]|nr:site-specific DNA-methyltransferase [Candidatus Falkowbacteria bacterium]
LIKATTNPNDMVLVLFGGSGAEIDVCRNLNRNFISAEVDKKYCALINDRLAHGFILPEHKLLQGRKRTET